ncbi:MAG: hypothetical protein A4E60_01945 [Syntrophorhabdus sp. PtaB.Bin047]|nr:MAG: hypothetical protein A4E60_01945 [Syntrophorhabdus sp. PtaB.Bin047]
MKLHCNDCSHDYDTVLPEDEIDIAVCPRCGSFGSSVPVTDVKETPEEPVTPPCVAAPVANPREVEIRPEAPPESREGSSSTPPSENATGRNVEGPFFSRIPKKGLIIAGGILVLLIAAGVTWTVMKGPGTPSGVDIVIETETVQAPEKPAPAPAPKVVKKAPAKTPTPKASTPSSNTPWQYRVESPTPAPKQPRAQVKETNPLGKLFKVFDGPAPDVTPPPAPNDARGSGM